MLTDLDISDVGFKERQMKELAEVLKSMHGQFCMRSINVRRNHFGKRGMRALGNAVLSQKSIEFVYCDHWFVGPETTTFIIRNEKMHAEDFMVLAGLMKANSVITALDIKGCKFPKSGEHALALAIRANPHGHIETITADSWIVEPQCEVHDLSKGELGVESVMLFGAMLATHRAMRLVRLPITEMSLELQEFMTWALATNETVTQLNDIALGESEIMDYSGGIYASLQEYEQRFICQNIHRADCIVKSLK